MEKLPILGDLVIPANGQGNRGGLRESKYLPQVLLLQLLGLAVGQGVIIPPVKEDGKEWNGPRQRQMVQHRVAMSLGREKRTDLPEFQLGVMPEGKGIGVKKVAEIRKATPEEQNRIDGAAAKAAEGADAQIGAPLVKKAVA